MKESGTDPSASGLREIALLFLRLGFTAFGGPAAHIAMMENEVVRKRNWMDHAHFLDLIGATNLIPGPNSTEMAIHIGYERAGVKGLLTAGACFILPAVLITGFLAFLYKSYGQLPQVQPFLYGIKPAIIAIILAAVYPLAKRALKTVTLGVIGLAVLIFCLAGGNEIMALFGAGIFAALLRSLHSRSSAGRQHSLWLPALVKAPAPLLQSTNLGLFLKFLKIGAILYGSGYVLFAFLDSELVSRGLLSRQQLTDAIAVGQFTPGPVFSAVTFVGWQISGFAGAALATLGVFIPSFLFIWLLNPLVPALRRSVLFSAFLDAVNIASVAIIISVCISLGKAAILDWKAVLIACLSAVVVFRFTKVNTAFVVMGGAVAGWILYALVR